FTRCYPTPSRWPSTRLVWGILLVGAVLAILSLTTSLVVYENTLTSKGLVRKSGPLFPIVAVYVVATWLTALGVMIDKWRRARGLARAQLQYLGTGVIIAATGGVGFNLLLPLVTGYSTYSWIGPYFSFVYVVLVAHAIIRHSLMDLRPVINRGITYILTVSFVSTVIVVLARSLVPGWAAEVLIRPEMIVIALVAFVMLATPARRFLDHVIDPYLYRGTFQDSSALRGATRRLSRLMQPTELASQLKQLLSEAFVPESFAMLVRPLEGGPFEALSGTLPVSLNVNMLHALLAPLPNAGVVVVHPVGENGEARPMHETLKGAGIEIVATLGRRGQLRGVILLGPRRSGDAYFKDDLVFVEALADLASVALENALLYRQSIQMLEYSDRLLEALDSAVVAIDVGGRV